METFLHWQIEYLLILQNFRELTHGIFNGFFSVATMFGEFAIPLMFMCLVYWFFNKKYGIYMLWNFFLGIMVNQFLKLTACIYRPWVLDSRIKPVDSAIKLATGYSFPSGHTGIAMGTWGALAVKLWSNKLARYGLIFLILLVGFSRNYLGVHTPQDVIVSIITGSILLFLTDKILRWVEKGKNRDLCVWGIVILLNVLILIYAELKSYPMDYLNGILLAEKLDILRKNGLDAFPKTGFIVGVFTGWLLDRRFLKYEPKTQISLWLKIVLFLIGVGLMMFLLDHTAQYYVNLLGKPTGKLTSYFVTGIFITVIYPAIIKFISKFVTK